jgi:hypothetical protein
MDEPLVFGVSFLVNGGVALLILRAIYAPAKRDKDYVLMFLTFNTLAFLIAGLLNTVELGMGLGLSLFAIFSILRFRTDPIPIREMTYLFVMMALPVVNALLMAQEAYAGLAVADLAVAGALILIEKGWGLRNVGQKSVVYERIEYIKPEYAQPLLADLRARTGLDITRCEVGKVDFLHDTAEIKITYIEPQQGQPAGASGAQADYTPLFSTKRGG